MCASHRNSGIVDYLQIQLVAHAQLSPQPLLSRVWTFSCTRALIRNTDVGPTQCVCRLVEVASQATTVSDRGFRGTKQHENYSFTSLPCSCVIGRYHKTHQTFTDPILPRFLHAMIESRALSRCVRCWDRYTVDREQYGFARCHDEC